MFYITLNKIRKLSCIMYEYRYKKNYTKYIIRHTIVLFNIQTLKFKGKLPQKNLLLLVEENKNVLGCVIVPLLDLHVLVF